MTELERLRRWKSALKRLRITPRRVAELWGISATTTYSWNCGLRPVPPKRLAQIEAMDLSGDATLGNYTKLIADGSNPNS